MNSRLWLVAYLIAAAVQLGIEFIGEESLEYWVKPLLMPLLFGYFLSRTIRAKSLRILIASGLVFSWVGDMALLPWDASRFFLLGLGGFLITHILYTLAFWRWPGARTEGDLKRKPWLAAPLVLFLLGLLYLLWPGLDTALKVPVLLYGFSITIMAVSARHIAPLLPGTSGALLTTGAILFLISDSMIGLSRFGPDEIKIPLVGFWIMLTYMLAQLLIVQGVSSRKEVKG